MTPQKAKKLLPIIQAFAEGKTIQLKYPPDIWIDQTSCSFVHDSDRYRIKPEKKKGWVNIYPDIASGAYESKEKADRAASRSRIACIKIEYEEGQGL